MFNKKLLQRVEELEREVRDLKQVSGWQQNSIKQLESTVRAITDHMKLYPITTTAVPASTKLVTKEEYDEWVKGESERIGKCANASYNAWVRGMTGFIDSIFG